MSITKILLPIFIIMIAINIYSDDKECKYDSKKNKTVEIALNAGTPSSLEGTFWITDFWGLSSSLGVDFEKNFLFGIDSRFQFLTLKTAKDWDLKLDLALSFILGTGSDLIVKDEEAEREREFKFGIYAPIGVALPFKESAVTFRTFFAPGMDVTNKDFDYKWGFSVAYNFGKAKNLKKYKECLVGTIGNLKGEIGNLQGEVGGLNDKVGNLQTELGDSKNENQNLKNINGELISNNSKLESERDQLKQQNINAQEQLERLEQEKNTLEEEKNSLEANLKGMEKEKDALESKLQNSSDPAEIAKLKKQLEEIQKQKEEAEKEKARLEAEKEKSQSDREKLEQSVLEYNKKQCESSNSGGTFNMTTNNCNCPTGKIYKDSLCVCRGDNETWSTSEKKCICAKGYTKSGNSCKKCDFVDYWGYCIDGCSSIEKKGGNVCLCKGSSPAYKQERRCSCGKGYTNYGAGKCDPERN
ncbi:hypothetical protein JXR93_02850 [bacterium]|nr:hypothetical protein [bacterium]